MGTEQQQKDGERENRAADETEQERQTLGWSHLFCSIVTSQQSQQNCDLDSGSPGMCKITKSHDLDIQITILTTLLNQEIPLKYKIPRSGSNINKGIC